MIRDSYAHSHTPSINPATQGAEGEADLATDSVLAAYSFQISALTFMIWNFKYLERLKF